jgi:ABC-2 type transport system permease protein
VTSAAPAALPADWAEVPRATHRWLWLPRRVSTFCLVESQKLRHDRTELLTRAIQPTLFVSVFYGIQVIWERDAGVLAKLVTPTPRSALVLGKGFAASVRAAAQVVVVIVVALLASSP